MRLHHTQIRRKISSDCFFSYLSVDPMTWLMPESTESQRPLSDVRSIIMEKLASAGEGRGCTITYKVAMYAPAGRADTPPVRLPLQPTTPH
jgi:hypothetical protein